MCSNEFKEVGINHMAFSLIGCVVWGASADGAAEAAESIRAELAAYVKGRTDEILNLSNRVARLKKELEKHEGEAMVQKVKREKARSADRNGESVRTTGKAGWLLSTVAYPGSSPRNLGSAL
eukprot:1141294-Pelagomonas_calceolata.AAC.3